MTNLDRIILHCDLNNFFASVECLNNPNIRSFPVAVCGSVEKRHGIVLAKNNIAKAFNIKTGETVWQAKNKCPDLVIVPPDFSSYYKFSRLAREVYESFTPLVESFGIDENWLDITASVRSFEQGIDMAYQIKEKIKAELGLTISVGVSFNKVFAKLGSDLKKPDAVSVISKENYKTIVWPLDVEDMLFVGSKTKSKLHTLGIYTIGQLANTNPNFLISRLGKSGYTLHIYANGLDNSEVVSKEYQHQIKGIGNSSTAPQDIKTFEEAKKLIYALAESVSERLRNASLKGSTVCLTIKDNTFFSIDRQTKFTTPTYNTFDIADKSYQLLKNNWNFNVPLRLLGVRVTDLTDANSNVQLSIFDEKPKVKKELIDLSIDNIRHKYGHNCIMRACLLNRNEYDIHHIDEIE